MHVKQLAALPVSIIMLRSLKETLIVFQIDNLGIGKVGHKLVC